MKFLKGFMILLAFLIFPLVPSACAENDMYSIVYSEISQYNKNAQEADWIAKAILYSSNTYSVDPLLVTAVMEQESHFNINSVSPAGAIGLMQLMPGTAEMIGVNPYNPLDNVVGGVIYLKNQLNQFAGMGTYAVTNAVAAYNAGPQAVLKYGGVPPYNETRNYVIEISNKYNRLNSRF